MKKAVTVIFSRNRALQLDLCLRTLLNHCKDILEVGNIVVLYRNDPEHEDSYATLMSEFPQIRFKKEQNFKKDMLSLFFNEGNILSNGFVTFVVDDQVFTMDFSIKSVVSILAENKDCLGFSLRLGKNCHRCYPYDCDQAIPKTKNIDKNILKYNWQDAEYDFNYCLELSASTYRIKDIFEILETCNYNSPNSLESAMSSCYYADKPNMLMFEKSISFGLPINKVQLTHNNRSMNIGADILVKKYMAGYRINPNKYDGYISSGCHDEGGINTCALYEI